MAPPRGQSLNDSHDDYDSHFSRKPSRFIIRQEPSNMLNDFWGVILINLLKTSNFINILIEIYKYTFQQLPYY